MATIAATIAELKFKQAIIRNPDTEARLPPAPADVIAQLFTSIAAVLQQNTPANVQVPLTNTPPAPPVSRSRLIHLL